MTASDPCLILLRSLLRECTIEVGLAEKRVHDHLRNDRTYKVAQKKTHNFQYIIPMQPFKMTRNSSHQNVHKIEDSDAVFMQLYLNTICEFA